MARDKKDAAAPLVTLAPSGSQPETVEKGREHSQRQVF